ncbi:hypothetical protein DICVIV_13136 [Dictyocaulus viviparus]|uniref:Uncharacterized protein n=1 Tax=Dictyocaulus viviparus TaxID=29172 RepID=A0A0D8XB77_DICVI|nr:hypothetical protein DICVIV_13136 [Dictyocaulus viviparus]
MSDRNNFTDAVHMLALKIVGVPSDAKMLKDLYISITKPAEPIIFRLLSNWERGGQIAALVSLIFVFFLLALFLCCCAFTQSALIIEDFNHRNEVNLIWRMHDQHERNRVHRIPELDIISVRSEATQCSTTESSDSDKVNRKKKQAKNETVN